MLVVRDTGVGIPLTPSRGCFNDSIGVQNRQSRTHEGSGIGLALVQEVVQLHGGTVRVESRLDEGSNFFITLPWGLLSICLRNRSPTMPRIPHAPDASPYLEEALQWLPDHESEVLQPRFLPRPNRHTRGRTFSLPTTMPTCVAT